MKISTSFLSSNYDTETTLKLIDKTSSDFIHVDIMDGLFVTNKTNDLKSMIDYLKKTSKSKDVHLMVDNPLDYIDKFLEIKPEYITFHLESDTDIFNTINILRENGIKVGIAVKPKTNIIEIVPYLGVIDLVLIMTVEPGAGGQRFMFENLEKVEFLKKIQKDYKYMISVDGGINEYTAILSKKSGVDMLVSGSYICKSNDLEKQIKKIRK